MIMEALRAMAIGIPGVFAVLAVFYAVLKLMMQGKKKGDSAESDNA
jgi:hypothetical protein